MEQGKIEQIQNGGDRMLECYFSFDKRPSKEFDLIIAYKEGEDTANFGVKREANIQTLPNSYKSYSLGTTHKPLTFPVRICALKPLTLEKRIEICNWLFKDTYCELYSEHEPEIIYYCKLQGDSNRFKAGDMKGYMDLEVVCCSPFAWSLPMSQTYNVAEINDVLEFSIRNDSNYMNWYECIFKIRIPHKINCPFCNTLNDLYKSAGDYLTCENASCGVDFPVTPLEELEFEIWNKTNSLREDAFVISSRLGNFPLQRGEYLQISMDSFNIITNASLNGLNGLNSKNPYPHRRMNCNNKFITLERGINNLEFRGSCDFEVITQVPILN